MIYSTTEMEQAAIRMHQTSKRVIVHCDYRIERRIRFRQNMVIACAPRVARFSDPGDIITKAWAREGGMLINMKQDIELPEADSLLVVEMPMERRLFGIQQKRARDAVIYRAPSWAGHTKHLDTIYPTGAACVAFWEMLEQRLGNHEYGSAAKAIGLTRPVAAISDAAASEALGIPILSMNRVRDLMFRGIKRNITMVRPLISRIEPENESLMPAYDFIRNGCPKLAGHSLLVSNSMSKVTRYWKTTLKLLVRDGAVEQQRIIGFYDLAGVHPEFNKIQRLREHGEIELREMIEYVEELPDYPL